MKSRAVVICPGRGTYNKPELGYLSRFHSDKNDFLEIVDYERKQRNQISVRDLDSRSAYSFKEHVPGFNSAALIYSCSYSDFMDIDRQRFEIVAVTGNSMGWYLAQACAGVYSWANAAKVVNTMGSQTKDGLVGAQIIYPIMDHQWRIDQKRKTKVLDLIDETIDCYLSIFFGGYLVIGGTDSALSKAMNQLDKVDYYPFKIPGNSAFHTPLLQDIADKAQRELTVDLFEKPKIPLIDGRGKVWMPYSFDAEKMWHYTFQTQVAETYNFSKCIEVATKEFAPDVLIITGPGTTMGGAVGQALIEHGLFDLHNKGDFIKSKQNPAVINMGDDQRKLVVKGK